MKVVLKKPSTKSRVWIGSRGPTPSRSELTLRNGITNLRTAVYRLVILKNNTRLVINAECHVTILFARGGRQKKSRKIGALLTTIDLI